MITEPSFGYKFVSGVCGLQTLMTTGSKVYNTRWESCCEQVIVGQWQLSFLWGAEDPVLGTRKLFPIIKAWELRCCVHFSDRLLAVLVLQSVTDTVLSSRTWPGRGSAEPPNCASQKTESVARTVAACGLLGEGWEQLQGLSALTGCYSQVPNSWCSHLFSLRRLGK